MLQMKLQGAEYKLGQILPTTIYWEKVELYNETDYPNCMMDLTGTRLFIDDYMKASSSHIFLPDIKNGEAILATIGRGASFTILLRIDAQNFERRVYKLPKQI